MVKYLAAVLALSAAAFAEYKVEPTGAPPSELAPAIASELQPAGQKVLDASGKVWCEVWLRKTAPTAPPSTESDVTWKAVPIGTVIGAIRWPGPGSDRRGQIIKPGVYTLRYGNYPINGDHQGVAPQRDFLVMSPAAADQNAAAMKFEDLMAMSKKASGTQHPAVLSMWLVESDFKPGMEQMGEHDQVLKTTVGDAKIALILAGKAE